MKLTTKQLKRIIKEELKAVLKEDSQGSLEDAAAKVLAKNMNPEQLSAATAAAEALEGKSTDEIAAMLQPDGPMQEEAGSNVKQAIELVKTAAPQLALGGVTTAITMLGASAVGAPLAPAALAALAISGLLTVGAHSMPKQPLSTAGQDKFRGR